MITTKLTSAFYLRTVVFGIEDSLVSTVGLLSGIAIANVERPVIFLSGLVLIFVESFSMGVGSYLSEHSSEEFVVKKHVSSGKSISGGVIMFVSYLCAGFIPLLPYMLFHVSTAFYVSIGAALTGLFILGGIRGRFSRLTWWRTAIEMCIIGGMAIFLGIVVGTLYSG